MNLTGKMKIDGRSSGARFNKLDFHDDNLASVKIYPPRKRTDTAQIDFQFEDDSTGAMKLVSFHRCANLRYIMDFDVLAANWFAQTKCFAAEDDVNRVKRFVRSQMANWHVKYMPPMPRDKPIRKKLSAIRSYHLFRIDFFGGTVEILAKSFSVKENSRELAPGT
jgi:hypothetical protein